MIVGITIITVSILVNQITKETFSKNNPGLDAVVGAKGSPLQLILSSIHHIDIPTGNISYQNALFYDYWVIYSKSLTATGDE